MHTAAPELGPSEKRANVWWRRWLDHVGPCSASECTLLFLGFAISLIVSHDSLLRLPYFWDEAGYYIPAARDLLAGSLIPHSTPSNAHPPLVMAWIALAWKLFGQSLVVTRCAMLLVAAFSLTGLYRLAAAVSNRTVALSTTLLTAIYPVFFAQSSLAQIDLPAAGLTFWAIDSYVRQRWWTATLWFSLAALAKETAILIPLALFGWKLAKGLRAIPLPRPHPHLHSFMPNTAPYALKPGEREVRTIQPSPRWEIASLLLPVAPIAAWYLYHYAHTGYIFGNPEFLRYNLQDNFHPLRIVVALLRRIWQTVGYLNLYVLTLACLLAMRYPALPATDSAARRAKGNATPIRPRIGLSVQFTFLGISTAYLLAMAILGGAVLARYMLPIVPLFILICVSTIWRRLKPWKAVLGVVALAFILATVVNPPYGFSPEDNLAYADYVRLHQRAEAFIEQKFPHAHVLTAWPASDELTRSYLGYVPNPVSVVRIEDFTAEQLMSARDPGLNYDLALVFSTKYQAPYPLLSRWRWWQRLESRYFGYHVDLKPEAAASVLGGTVVYEERRHGQWVGVIKIERIQDAHVLVRKIDEQTAIAGALTLGQ